jgi:hypothetical protein
MNLRTLVLAGFCFLHPVFAVEPVRELRIEDPSPEPGRCKVGYKMTVVTKPGEFVLATYREYEGKENGPESPARRVIEQLIQPGLAAHVETLEGTLFEHRSPGTASPALCQSRLSGFGQIFTISDLRHIGGGGGSRTQDGRITYVSRKFKFADALTDPGKQITVRFTMEVISEELMLAKLKNAGLGRPTGNSAEWRVKLPEPGPPTTR